MTRFVLSDSLDARMVPIGTVGEHVMIIDDVMKDVDALRDGAAEQRFRDVGRSGGFPGLRAALPKAYVHALLKRLDPHLRRHFFEGRAMELRRFDCNFSLVTYPPETLDPKQKLPHVDIADGNRIALLHYLCSDHFGGTAFYRQDATGLERVDPADKPACLAAWERELAALPKARGYADATLSSYTQIASVSARPNRLIAYRSNLLHSGIVDDPSLLSPDPRYGRLTANFFLDYAPAAH